MIVNIASSNSKSYIASTVATRTCITLCGPLLMLHCETRLTFVLRNTWIAGRTRISRSHFTSWLARTGRFSRSTMWKTAFYACVLLLASIGEQLSPSRLMKIVRGFLEMGKAQPLDELNPFTCVPCF